MRHFVFFLVVFFFTTAAVAGEQPKNLKFKEVPFTAVHFDDTFWSPRMKVNREISIPHNYKWCEDTGRFTNFAKAAKLLPGEFQGIYFNDSDVYKLLEGTACSLADHPDPNLEKQADDVIAWIAAAQEPNGYLNSYYTLKEPDKKWTNITKHELYCCGHLIEAAVAYNRATGKDSLLNVAEKFVDHIISVFGPEKPKSGEGAKFEVPGHEEIELALVKLYDLTGKEKYLKLSERFIDVRGDQSKRGDKIHGPYDQDHRPIREQSEIVGHAVRAVYLYSGVADVAAYTGDKGLIDAMDRLWNDVVNKKMYITGGIGARHAGEAFGDAYELPNRTAYCETCAAIGLAFWAHRMNLLHGDAKYADVMERAIYNGVLSGIGMDGKSFFYVNPLESTGNHHRQPFFDCACCPTNVVRFVSSLPGYQYAVDKDGVVVNMFVQGNAMIKLPEADVSIKIKTDYPWVDPIRFSVTVKRHDSESKKPITLKLRVPDWCHYPDEEPKIELKHADKGHENDMQYKIEKGYVVTSIRTEPEFDFVYRIPFTYRRVAANPHVAADRGRVALQYGPIVYCFEEADNPGLNDRTKLKRDMQWHEDIQGSQGGDLSRSLPGAPSVIRVKSSENKDLFAIPYYAWDSRNKPGRMMVWIRQEGLPRNLDPESPVWKTTSGEPRLYQPLPDDKCPYYPRDPKSKPANCLLTDVPDEPETAATASFCHGKDTVDAMIDGLEPKNSSDHDIPRMTFWDHKGTKEWIELDFGTKKTVSKTSIYWFDDEAGKGGCRIPKSWTLSYRDGNEWKAVKMVDAPMKNAYDAVEFKAVETTGLRIDIQLREGFSGGVLQWKAE